MTLNLGRIISVEAGEAVEHVKSLKKGELAEQTLVLEIEDERSTMVRALMHFPTWRRKRKSWTSRTTC